jgi:hypothetical protein
MPFLPMSPIIGHAPSARLTKNTERTISNENRAASQAEAEAEQVSRSRGGSRAVVAGGEQSLAPVTWTPL